MLALGQLELLVLRGGFAARTSLGAHGYPTSLTKDDAPVVRLERWLLYQVASLQAEILFSTAQKHSTVRRKEEN